LPIRNLNELKQTLVIQYKDITQLDITDYYVLCVNAYGKKKYSK